MFHKNLDIFFLNEKCIINFLIASDYSTSNSYTVIRSQVFKTLWDSLTQAESKSYLNISMKGKPGPEECLFGLTSSDFDVDARQKKILHHVCILYIDINRMEIHSCSALSIFCICLLYTSPSPRDKRQSRMPSSA